MYIFAFKWSDMNDHNLRKKYKKKATLITWDILAKNSANSFSFFLENSNFLLNAQGS